MSTIAVRFCRASTIPSGQAVEHQVDFPTWDFPTNQRVLDISTDKVKLKY